MLGEEPPNGVDNAIEGLRFVAISDESRAVYDRIKILDHQPAARLECGLQLGKDCGSVGQMHEDVPGVYQVESAEWQCVANDIVTKQLDIPPSLGCRVADPFQVRAVGTGLPHYPCP